MEPLFFMRRNSIRDEVIGFHRPNKDVFIGNGSFGFLWNKFTIIINRFNNFTLNKKLNRYIRALNQTPSNIKMKDFKCRDYLNIVEIFTPSENNTQTRVVLVLKISFKNCLLPEVASDKFKTSEKIPASSLKHTCAPRGSRFSFFGQNWPLKYSLLSAICYFFIVA